MVEKRNPLSYLGLNHNVKKGLKWAVWLTLALITYFAVLNLVVLRNDVDFNIGFSEWLNTIIMVGLIEEIVFRGFC
ncbi:hypothetical protein VBD025_16490 [Virgibacillus flavescens]|uniref:hypothetical protein n=1 Tax=Virgibacillus flavescens TaxID=1611422 RepID=UPI003D3419BE